MINDHLAEPFSEIFVDRSEAEWAFDLLRDAARRLRISGAYDPRLAVTLSQRSGRRLLHLNFGGWLVLGFRGPGQTPERVDIALLAQRVAWDERLASFSFERKEGEPEVRCYALPLSLVRPMTSELRQAFEATLDFIAARFEHWSRSTRWKYHRPEIVEALGDPERRARLLAAGLEAPELLYERQYTPFGEELVLAEEEAGYGEVEDKAEAEAEAEVENKNTVIETTGRTVEEYGRPRLDMGYFTSQTFELLLALKQNPTADFYSAQKPDFEKYLLRPFKALFRDVAEQLPPEITEVMETQKRLFSRIPKNDYGQGGTWDFYWGAFYPKGSKRTIDAQLSMWINHERLEFGFYIGEYGNKSRERFLRNCQTHYEMLLQLLPSIFAGEKVIFGRHDEIVVTAADTVESKLDLSWQEWLQNPQAADFDASVSFTASRVLSFSRTELRNKIVDTYRRFFPLILLATEDEPLPKIKRYISEVLSISSKTEPLVSEPQDVSSQAEVDSVPHLNPAIPLSQLAADTGFEEADLARWVRAIERKGQAILYGPPGTGKTFLAEKLAVHLIGGGDGFCELVQFHPAYAYEDFIQGLRPEGQGDRLSYPLKAGRFLEFCVRAARRSGPCVLIIDEINRANLARVFGELMYLLEYRRQAIPLAGGGSLRIPDNVRLIGTMNTADRSIALVDHALRRRFAFIALAPNYAALRRYHQQHNPAFPVETLIGLLVDLNQAIADPHYEVGITFFLLPELSAQLEDIWRMEIEPYLEEYFFNQPDQLSRFRWPAIEARFSP